MAIHSFSTKSLTMVVKQSVQVNIMVLEKSLNSGLAHGLEVVSETMILNA